MLRLIVLRLKEISYLTFFLLAACMLMISVISSRALAGHSIPPTLAVYDADAGEDAARLISILSESREYGLLSAYSRDQANRLLSMRSVSGLLVIEPGFSQRLSGKNVVDFYPAVGATEARALSEHVAGAILQLRVHDKLNSSLSELGKPPVETVGSVEPVISVEYFGTIGELPVLMPPRHGAALLFFMLSWPHAAMVLRANRRARVYGGRAASKDFFSGAISVFLIWGTLALVYVLFLRLMYGSYEDICVILAFLSFILYNIGFGGFFAVQDKGIVFFIPYFLLNMTVGGGLWEIVTAPGYIWFITPLVPALSAAKGLSSDAVILFAPGAIMIIWGGIAHVLQKLWTKRIRHKRVL